MAENYPTAAYLLLLIGGILELIGIIPYIAFVGIAGGGLFFIGSVAGVVGMAILAVCLIWFLIWSILQIMAAMWVKKGDRESVHKGAVWGLIASILGGFNIISLIGAILAFTWKPPAPVVVPPPPPL